MSSHIPDAFDVRDPSTLDGLQLLRHEAQALQRVLIGVSATTQTLANLACLEDAICDVGPILGQMIDRIPDSLLAVVAAADEALGYVERIESAIDTAARLKEKEAANA